ncbi:LysR family transcriptional regulator [Apilactobacillus bombintestini]|uniref:LysR family transcriptional regulator n=1 Tax=Apilactobacillus bombintestini TaxID=2419772 RepID=A0A387AQE6_9LACO|nr:LysR family transcriptional regulator [Apilactobacillus bombintestini]AYF92992.1 LysR family transcriptional regulator [Apilactobacillus bombintestini]
MISFSYQAFVTVVSEASFHHAAQKLGVTPSAISHSMDKLEKQLGFSLLIRDRSGVKLTEDGKEVLPIIQDILNNEERLQQEANNIKGLTSGTIRLGAFSSVCINWLPSIINKFHNQFPNVNVEVTQSDFNDITLQSRQGKIDLGFTCQPINERLVKVLLMKDRIYCITPKDFVPKNGKTITKSDIVDKHFILQKSDYDGDTKEVLDQYNVAPNSIQFSIDDQSIIAMVEAGLGMGILPKLAFQRIGGDVSFYPFDDDFYRSIFMVMNSVQMKTPAVQKMVSCIRELIEEEYPNGILN